MARLLLISEQIAKNNVNNVGDVGGVFPDSWKFSSTEVEKFTIVEIPSLSVEECKQIFYTKKPKVKPVWDCLVIGFADAAPIQKEAWQDGGTWKLLEESYAQKPNVSALLETDIVFLADPVSEKATVMDLLTNKTEFVFVSDVNNQVEITIEAVL